MPKPQNEKERLRHSYDAPKTDCARVKRGAWSRLGIRIVDPQLGFMRGTGICLPLRKLL